MFSHITISWRGHTHRPVRRSWRKLAALAALLTPIELGAVVPASHRDVLCDSSLIVVADVLRASSADCRLSGSTVCTPQDVVRLTIDIKRVLARRNSVPRAWLGRVIEVKTSVVQIEHMRPNLDLLPNGGLIVAPTTGHPLSDRDVEERFVGKSYVFALQTDQAALPYWGSTWDLNREGWIRSVLQRDAGNSCPPLRSFKPQG